MKKIKRIVVWSNLFFIFPLLFSINCNLYAYAFIIGSMILTSSVYHWNNERKFTIFDYITSTLLMASNFTLLITGDWTVPYSIIGLSSAIIAIYFWSRQYIKKSNYDLDHGLWHLFSALVCYFSIMTFLN